MTRLQICNNIRLIGPLLYICYQGKLLLSFNDCNALGLYQYKQLPQGISISPDVAKKQWKTFFVNSLIAWYAISMILPFSVIHGNTTSI